MLISPCSSGVVMVLWLTCPPCSSSGFTWLPRTALTSSAHHHRYHCWIMGTILGIWVPPGPHCCKATGLEFAAGTGTSSMLNISHRKSSSPASSAKTSRPWLCWRHRSAAGRIAITIPFRLRYLKNKKAAVALSKKSNNEPVRKNRLKKSNHPCIFLLFQHEKNFEVKMKLIDKVSQAVKNSNFMILAFPRSMGKSNCDG